jgi:hypothetical protein
MDITLPLAWFSTARTSFLSLFYFLACHLIDAPQPIFTTA